MFEKNIILSIFFGGGCIGFSRGNIDRFLDDINSLQPTIFAGTPTLFKQLYDLIIDFINSDIVTRNMFYYGYKISKYDYSISNNILQKTIFTAIRNKLGGKMRIMIIGMGCIENDIIDFMKVCFNCIVIQQYGLTETASCISLTNHYDKIIGHNGGPIICGEFCLKRYRNLESYSITAETSFKGELLYKGYNLFKGYYTGSNQSNTDNYQIDTDLTNSYIDKHGWFHTGDYVSILKNGAICYIDRIDSLINKKK